MFRERKELFNKIVNYLNGENNFSQKPTQEKDWKLIEEAKKDWKDAREYFNTVTEPELIDHAIYTLEAAEKRYVYLLKKAREERIFQEKFFL
jgi:uncharacterized protein (UPF0210 family)